MARRTVGTSALAGVFFVAGLTGIVACWAAWPRTSTTSPLMALFALVWGCTFIVTAILTWRRSRFAAPLFVAAIGVMLLPARFLFPEGQLSLLSFVVISFVAFFGYRYLGAAREAA